ncbi:MAG: heat-inducible transcriptional repressor HrcA, partial [Atopostipes sp.]|nr:heat-inducible transcriptional repressor HrcA [Atopostipes sp.]
QSIVKKGDIQASSATIRNEMTVLEKLYLIEKVHSSSGRIPTVKGYRYYVDNLMQPKKIREEKRIEIKSFLDKHIFQMRDVFYQSAELVSQLTNYTAIVLGPQSELSRLTAFRILPITDQQMMILLQLDNQEVQSMSFRIPKDLKTSHIKQVTRFINKNLVGESLSTVYYALKNDLPQMFDKYLAMNWNVPEMLERSLQSYTDDKMFVSGKSNLLDFTDDLQLSQVKDLYQLLDNQRNLLALLEKKEGIERTYNVQIGDEFNDQLLESLSLVTVPYQDNQFGEGLIAVLGPKNMTYDLTVGIVQVLKEELLYKLEDFYLE